MDNYHKIDKELFFFYKKILMQLSPVNLEKEKEKVFENKNYNPIFRYEKHQYNLSQVKQKLKELTIKDGVFGKLLNQKREELIDHCNLLESIGTKKLTYYSKKLYGFPNQDLLKKAYEILQLKIPKSNKSALYGSFSSVKKISESLKLDYKFDWKIKLRDMPVNAWCNPIKKILYINKNKKFTEMGLKRIIAHEIGTHIQRAENGKKQRYLLFFYGFPDYLLTEEGLAVYNEKINNLLTHKTLRTYAGRAIAVELASKNPFSIVYNELLQYFDKETAWNLTVRVKRGVINTSEKEAFTKDYIYLKGKNMIEDFVKGGGNIKDLYIGKIGLQHLPLVSKIL